MRSTRPTASRVPSRMSSNWYFTDDEPELRTRTRTAGGAAGSFGAAAEGDGWALTDGQPSGRGSGTGSP